MKTTLNIPESLFRESMAASKINTKTGAVIAGLKELIRQKKIEGILSSAGELEFSDQWNKGRHER